MRRIHAKNELVGDRWVRSDLARVGDPELLTPGRLAFIFAPPSIINPIASLPGWRWPLALDCPSAHVLQSGRGHAQNPRLPAGSILRHCKPPRCRRPACLAAVSITAVLDKRGIANPPLASLAATSRRAQPKARGAASSQGKGGSLWISGEAERRGLETRKGPKGGMRSRAVHAASEKQKAALDWPKPLLQRGGNGPVPCLYGAAHWPAPGGTRPRTHSALITR
jgi:hypothetical protein